MWKTKYMGTIYILFTGILYPYTCMKTPYSEMYSHTNINMYVDIIVNNSIINFFYDMFAHQNLST